jgi:hypothetical protein
MVDSKLQNFINKSIERFSGRYGDDYIEHIKNIDEITDGDYPSEVIFGSVFYYIINVKNEDPLDYISLYDLSQRFYAEDITKILEFSGWLEIYYKLDRFIGTNWFNDIKWAGNTPFLICDNWSELSDLFEIDDQNAVENILGEDWSELYDMYGIDFSDEIIDNLDEESIQHIKDYIKEGNFIGEELNYVPDGYDSTLLTEEMVDDTDTILQLINEEDIFDELKGELENFYRWAYNTAAEDELFNEIKYSIEGLLGSTGKWEEIKKGDKTNHVLIFDISSIFMGFNDRFLVCEGSFPEEEYGSFLEVISKTLNCEGEKLSGPNIGYFYPDSSKVSENLNDNVIGNL